MSVTFTYEGNTVYWYILKVYCNIDVTKVADSCERNEVFAHCSLSFFSARCLLLTLMKHYNVFTQMKSSLYFRYNLSRTQL